MSATPWVLWIAGGLAFLLVALGMRPAIRGWKALGPQGPRGQPAQGAHAGDPAGRRASC
jgi:hypothetical protein